MGFLEHEISSLPLWLYMLCGLLAVLAGKGIRVWLDRRERQREARLKEQRKEVKAQQKRIKKQLKKAGKTRDSISGESGKPPPDSPER